ncbi:MAG: glycosyltransferase [Pseudomonadota bacterium]
MRTNFDRQFPPLSVIVSTYNASDYLQLCLTALAQQTQSNFELIVADDGSTDEHRESYQQVLQKLDFNARLLWQPDEGFRKSTILNAALEASRGEYIIFIDGDCIVAPDFVAQHCTKARPGRFLTGTRMRLNARATKTLLAGAERTRPPRQIYDESIGHLPRTRVWLKGRASDFGIAGLASLLDPTKRTFNGCNSSCWRADAFAIGGFDQRFCYGGEDVEFGERLANYGVTAHSVRYHARGLHLHHGRPYFDEQAFARNMELLNSTRGSQRMRTEHGINDAAEDGNP